LIKIRPAAEGKRRREGTEVQESPESGPEKGILRIRRRSSAGGISRNERWPLEREKLRDEP
jgi:hypothetical protein